MSSKRPCGCTPREGLLFEGDAYQNGLLTCGNCKLYWKPEERRCVCGGALYTGVVKKEGKNKGRVFSTCKLKLCSHFEWHRHS